MSNFMPTHNNGFQVPQSYKEGGVSWQKKNMYFWFWVRTMLLKIWQKLFWPIVHRCKNCSHISEVTSGGRAEIEDVKNDRAYRAIWRHDTLTRVQNWYRWAMVSVIPNDGTDKTLDHENTVAHQYHKKSLALLIFLELPSQQLVTSTKDIFNMHPWTSFHAK